MRKDSKGNIIGNGEDSAVLILMELFPFAKIQRQVPITKLITNKEIISLMSAENKKRTIDIYFETGQVKYCVRVQNGGKGSNFNKFSHISEGRSRIDKVQRIDLEADGFTVVDLNQRDCPILFKEIVNDESRAEVKSAFEPYWHIAETTFQKHNC